MNPIVKYEIQTLNLVRNKILPEVIIKLKCQVPIMSVININNFRYAIIQYNNEQGTYIKYAVLFKKEKFHSFGTIYREQGEMGEGETINKDDFDRYFIDCEKIIFVYQTSYKLEIKYIKPLEVYELQVKNKCYYYINKSDKKEEIIFSVNYLKDYL